MPFRSKNFIAVMVLVMFSFSASAASLNPTKPLLKLCERVLTEARSRVNEVLQEREARQMERKRVHNIRALHANAWEIQKNREHLDHVNSAKFLDLADIYQERGQKLILIAKDVKLYNRDGELSLYVEGREVRRNDQTGFIVEY